MNIQNIIEILKQAPRIGTETDIPEGNRYVQISETLINEILLCLESYNQQDSYPLLSTTNFSSYNKDWFSIAADNNFLKTIKDNK